MGAVEVQLAKGRGVALVDEADGPAVLAYRWYLHEVKGKQYARSSKAGYLHRFVAGLVCGDRLEVDHIDGDGLNNQRSNMRTVTHAQNQQNRLRQRGRRSRYRGVTWYATRRQWMVRVKVGGVEHFGGYYEREEAAGHAAALMRARLMPYATA